MMSAYLILISFLSFNFWGISICGEEWKTIHLAFVSPNTPFSRAFPAGFLVGLWKVEKLGVLQGYHIKYRFLSLLTLQIITVPFFNRSLSHAIKFLLLVRIY